MKSLCLLVSLGVLACVLAPASTSAEQTSTIRTLRPLVPSKEERIRRHLEVGESSSRSMRLLENYLANRPQAAAKKSAVEGLAVPARSQKSTRAKPAVRTRREAQPDFAGRVAVTPNSGERIINGAAAKLGEFPWQAAIDIFVSRDESYWCGGSIVHSMWILTAAHCLDMDPEYYTVTVGSIRSRDGNEPSKQRFTGQTEVYTHPAYNPYYVDNDIGFIKLSQKLKYNDYVRPVKMPSYSMATDMMVGKTGRVSGWGVTSDYIPLISSDLRWIHNTIDDGAACYKYYGNAYIANKICVQPIDNKSFCQGDSGGAFTIEEEPGVFTQLGIVSFGSTAGCETEAPIAYTRLASYLDFVEETTNLVIRQ